MSEPRIFPIILAAGPAPRLTFPKPLAKFGRRNALEIAVENCADLEAPIVVLGYAAGDVRRAMAGRGGLRARVVVNRGWRRGQLSSLLTGLHYVPRGADFMIYPVDQSLITKAMVNRLARAFRGRGTQKKIAMPKYRGREGHPILCAGELRGELRRVESAREIVYRDESRILFVEERSAVIWMDFSSPSSYRRCVKKFRA